MSKMKVNKKCLAEEFEQQKSVAHASCDDTTSLGIGKHKKLLKAFLKNCSMRNTNCIPESVAVHSKKKGRNDTKGAEDSDAVDDTLSIVSNGTSTVTKPSTEVIEVEIGNINGDDVQPDGDSDVELVEVSEYAVFREKNTSTIHQNASEVLNKRKEQLAAEEAQLLAEEKRILAKLEKINAHKNRLQLERLELEKMRSLLANEPRRQIYHYRHEEPARKTRRTGSAPKVVSVVSVEIIEDC